MDVITYPCWSTIYTVVAYITHHFDSISYTIEVWEWISNFIPHFIMDVIINPC